LKPRSQSSDHATDSTATMTWVLIFQISEMWRTIQFINILQLKKTVPITSRSRRDWEARGYNSCSLN
jgi:hypothetical protein